MSETPELPASGSAPAGGRAIDYDAVGTTRSGMLRLGGALGIAACAVGLAVMVAACAGLNKVVVLSLVPVALSIPGLIISVVGAIVQKNQIAEDTHVMHALFANLAGLIGGLLEMAAWQNWAIFHR
jgi:hypothetical protein